MAGVIEAKLQGGDLLKKFSDKRFGEQLLSVEWIEAFKERLVEKVRDEAPVGKHFDISGQDLGGGELKHSIEGYLYHYKGGIQILIKSKSPHAKYVLHGTAPHEINAISGGWLQFWWENMNTDFPLGAWADNWYYGDGTHVQHPGTKPNKFATRAWAKIMVEELTIFRASIRKQIGG